jgi:hypothetical protein
MAEALDLGKLVTFRFESGDNDGGERFLYSITDPSELQVLK